MLHFICINTVVIIYACIGGRPASNTEIQSRHLGKIADAMVEWEGAIADMLKLTPSDVAAIKIKYPQRFKLQS